MKKKWVFRILFFAGFLLCVLPIFWNIISSGRQSEAVRTYRDAAGENKADMDALLKKAEKYNERIYQSEGVTPEAVTDKEEYEEQLDVTGTGIMGSLEIPKISVELPVYHGTDEKVLADGIGHIQWTSLPVGGENTHSVLTGHRGLPSSKLLTRLDELEKGDSFFLNICGRIMEYQVFRIQTVEPENISSLKIQAGKDLASVVTCTPYGLNTHRLIVTGKRIPYEQKKYDAIEAAIPSGRELFFNFLPLFFLIPVIGSYFGEKFRRKKRRMKRKMKKLIMILALCLSVVSADSVTANEKNMENATEDMQTEEKTGDITVKLRETGTENPIEGIGFWCIKVGEISEGMYVLDKKFQDKSIDLNAVENAEELKYTASVLAQYAGGGKYGVTDKAGQIKFDGLEIGVYLIKGEDNPESDLISPAIVPVPYFSEETGEMLYSAEVEPKHEPRPEKTDVPKTGDQKIKAGYLMAGVSAALVSLVMFLMKYGKRKERNAG